MMSEIIIPAAVGYSYIWEQCHRHSDIIVAQGESWHVSANIMITSSYMPPDLRAWVSHFKLTREKDETP